MASQNTTNYSISAVETALELLEVFGDDGVELGVTSLAKRLGVSKSRVFRLLATFEQKGYVQKARFHGQYDIGMSAYATSRKLLGRMALLEKAKPVMEALVRDCLESIYLATPVADEILLLEMVNTSQQVQTIPLVGKRYPRKAVAAGAVVEAFSMSSEHAAEWEAVQKQGYQVDHDKLAAGVSSVAAPIFGKQGHVVGSLCVVGPSFRLTDDTIARQIIDRLKNATALISAKLGYLEKGYQDVGNGSFL